jgi:hypothetical protein
LTPFSQNLAARPVLWLPQLWAYGVVELSILYSASLFYPDQPDRAQSDWYQAVDAVRSLSLPSSLLMYGQFAVRVRHTSFVSYAADIQDFIVWPLIKRLSWHLAAPWLLALACNIAIDYFQFTVSSDLRIVWNRVCVYELAFLFTFRRQLFRIWRTMAQHYVQSVKDHEYLLERRVLDYAG